MHDIGTAIPSCVYDTIRYDRGV